MCNLKKGLWNKIMKAAGCLSLASSTSNAARWPQTGIAHFHTFLASTQLFLAPRPSVLSEIFGDDWGKSQLLKCASTRIAAKRYGKRMEKAVYNLMVDRTVDHHVPNKNSPKNLAKTCSIFHSWTPLVNQKNPVVLMAKSTANDWYWSPGLPGIGQYPCEPDVRPACDLVT